MVQRHGCLEQLTPCVEVRIRTQKGKIPRNKIKGGIISFVRNREREEKYGARVDNGPEGKENS